MNIKPNNPFVVGLAILVIIGLILVISSMHLSVVSGSQNTSNSISAVLASSLNYSNQNLSNEGLIYPKAPELAGISGYLNSNDSLTISNLKGKVVLLDFWTYSCINCIRTLPYLEAWDQKYRAQGLVIIGVQSPEFEFEKNYGNVQMAVQKFGIQYPVVLDNDHATWNAYRNLYWPHDYLIDANGYIRSDSIGEGNYATTESEIQQLLKERNQNMPTGSLVANNISANYDLSQVGTREIYLGYNFARQAIGNPEGFQPDSVVNYSVPANLNPNIVYFSGSWKNNADNMELASGTGDIVLIYKAKNLNLVGGGNSTLDIYLDNQSLNSSSFGSDATRVGMNALVSVESQRLYSLINKADYAQAKVTIHVNTPGFKIYTFTFG